MRDDYLWRGHYSDQTTIDEIGPDGVPRPFADIDLSRLKALELIGERSYVVPISPGIRPIFFRRRRIETTMDGAEVGRSTITCIGWQKTERGRNVQSFLFLFPDGSSVLSDDRNAV